jgi:hypothetical protein
MNVYVEPGTVKGDNIISPTLTKATVAKKIVVSTGRERCYVKTYRGKIVDPQSDYFKRDIDAQRWTYVTEEIYGLYLKYLRTGRTQFLTSAERKR